MIFIISWEVLLTSYIMLVAYVTLIFNLQGNHILNDVFSIATTCKKQFIFIPSDGTIIALPLQLLNGKYCFTRGVNNPIGLINYQCLFLWRLPLKAEVVCQPIRLSSLAECK